MKTLIICAHLDDESFGLGGTLIKLASENPNDVRVISLCRGRSEDDSEKRIISFNSIISELQCQHHIYEYRDLTLDKVDFLNLVALIQKEINSFRPDVVFSTSDEDLHRDHRIVAEATKLASRPLANCSIRTLYQFKIPGASDWNFTGQNFNVAFDITAQIEKKIDFCSRYQTEIKQRDSLNPCSLAGIKLGCQRDGQLFGFNYAELCKLVYKKT